MLLISERKTMNSGLNFLKDDNSKYVYRKYSDMASNLYYGQISRTKFLDPNEQSIVISILKKHKLIYKIYSSFENCERKVIYFSNDDFDLDDFISEDMSVLYIHSKNHNLAHKDVLGALMSTSIERDLIGDIVLNNDYIEVNVLTEIADYIRFNLKSIKRLNVFFELKADIYMDDSLIQYEDRVVTISSSRLDTFLASVLNMSRSSVKTIIQREYGKQNYVVESNPSSIVEEGDCISVRGYGRYFYNEFLGTTRKDKERISIRKIL